MEMVKTSVQGTMNVIEAEMAAKVRRVVFLSSDQAWQPISAYGQSKALAETLVLNANNQTPKDGPSFRVVRYGNVAGSRGSVIPKWKSMKKMGFDSVDVTDPDCTRFYMTIDEAVDLVLSAAKPDNDKPILIPQLPAYKLGDLAEVIGVRKHIIGLPAWEKKHEGMDFGNTSDIARRMTQRELSEAVAAI